MNNLLTHTQNVIYHNYKHNSSVKYQMYIVTVQCTQGLGDTPLLHLSLCVSEAGMLPEAATPPCHCTMRPELGIYSLRVNSGFPRMRRDDSKSRQRHLRPKLRSKCARGQAWLGYAWQENTYRHNNYTYSPTNNIQHININYLHQNDQYALWNILM